MADLKELENKLGIGVEERRTANPRGDKRTLLEGLIRLFECSFLFFSVITVSFLGGKKCIFFLNIPIFKKCYNFNLSTQKNSMKRTENEPPWAPQRLSREKHTIKTNRKATALFEVLNDLPFTREQWQSIIRVQHSWA